MTTDINQNLIKCVDICLLIDRSFSMHTLGNSVIQGAQEFLNTQKNTENASKTQITIATFDDKVEIMPGFDNVNLLDTDKIHIESLKPRGATRLIDTAMEKLKEQQQRLQKNKDVDMIAIFALLTDGKDNASATWEAQDLKMYIKTLEEKNKVTCFFLASNQDAIVSGSFLGFSPGRSLSYAHTPDKAVEAMRAVSQTVTMRSKGFSGESIEFTPLQRSTTK